MGQHIPEVRVHYGKGWAITILIGATLLLVMAPFVRTWMTGVLGAVNLLMGILMLTQPMIVLGNGSLQLKNMFGMTVRRFEYSSLTEFDVDDKGVIWHTDGAGTRKKLRLSRISASSSDWKRLIDTLATRAFD